MKKIIAAILCAALMSAVIPVCGALAADDGSGAIPGGDSEYTYTALGNQVSRKEQELNQKYEQGIRMEPAQVSARKERVKELGLAEYVDGQYFLYYEYYRQYSIDELERKGMMLLVRVMTEEELEAWEMRLKSGIAPLYITTENNVLAWTNSAGITSRTYAFEVDGHIAFCGDAKLTPPATGAAHSEYILVEHPQIKKILYYGYGGPEDQMKKLGYSRAQAYNIMAIAISNLRKGQALGAGGRVFWDAIKNLPDPPAGDAYYVETFASNLQDLFFYVLPKKGKLKLQKSSANQEVTGENSCYSFEGAEFGVYTNANGVSGKVGTLVTGKDGISQTLELDAGTYYIKELKAPPGYALDDTIREVTVTTGETAPATVSVKDKPQMNPMEILLEKVDADSGKNVPQGSATLGRAHFRVKFYGGLWEKDADPAMLGEIPDREWVFETDEGGICKYDNDYLVDGDELYYLSENTPALPLGTITIQEIKASEGYLINQVKYILQITSEGTAETVHTYNKSTIFENIFKLDLVKRQEGTDKVIPNAEFQHTKPDGTAEILKTDREGKLTFSGLSYGEHKIRELSVMDGYEINGNIITFTVAEDNTVTLNGTFDESDGNIRFEMTGEGNIRIEMEDRLAPFDLVIHKINDRNKTLDGAEFTLYAEKDCETAVAEGVTRDGGKLRFDRLLVGRKYYLKETKAPAGYRIPADLFGKPIVYEIETESVPVEDTFLFYVDGTACHTDSDGRFTVTGTKADREGNMTIENRIGRKLPVTGSTGMVFICLIQIVCFAAVVMYTTKKNK